MGSSWSKPTTSPLASTSQASPPKPFHVKKVAIIGAGPSGLTAAKYLKAQGTFDSIVIFEQQDEVGGVWHYSSHAPEHVPVPQQDPFWGPEPSLWPDGAPAPVFPSPMYERLHANIPGTLMGFHDQKFPEDAWAFPKRQQLQEYLVRYSQDVRSLVRFCLEVKRITLSTEDGRDQWHVEAASTTNGEPHRETFDAVVLANGHYSVPYIPAIPNIAEFHKAHPSIITHSKQYRTNTPFKDKKVIVVGNGPSGVDIAQQINEVSARKTMLSVRHPTPPEKLEHMGCEEIAEIIEFLPDQRAVRLKDGSTKTGIDHIVFCTGFLFGYPFLPDLQHKLITSGRGVHGLYEHLFYIDHPTLVFPALNMKSVPWPLAEAQAAVFSAVWSNSLALPPVAEMKKWSKDLEDSEGEALHVFPTRRDGEYINEFHDWAKKATHLGKEPPFWDGELFWERKIFAEAKMKFEEDGCKAKTLEELGFHYNPDAESLELVVPQNAEL